MVEATFRTSRHTAVTLEARSLLADFNPAERQLTVWQSTQVPYMTQWILARHFGLPETQVRVIAPDVGGGFGLKIHAYGDELATVAAALLLGRPVKFVADRLESFTSDFHARGHRVKARMALAASGDDPRRGGGRSLRHRSVFAAIRAAAPTKAYRCRISSRRAIGAAPTAR